MKKPLTLALAGCILLAACGAPSTADVSPAAAMPFGEDITLHGSFVKVQFPQETAAVEDTTLIFRPLLLELEGRALIWKGDALWWVNTADGAIISRQELKMPRGAADGAIRAEALGGEGYDFRVYTSNMAVTGDSGGKLEPIVYTLPDSLSDTLTGFEGRHIPFALGPDGQTLAYTDAEGCWLADSDGSGKELVFPAGGIGKIMGPGYPVEAQKPWYWEPRFLDGGRVLAASVYDETNAGTRALSLLRLDTGEVRHYAGLYGGLSGSFQYFDDTVLINREWYIDTRDFSEHTRPAKLAHTWDGDFFWEGDSSIKDKVLLYRGEDLETPIQLLQVEGGNIHFQGMTRTITLWRVEPFTQGMPPVYLLVPYR